jgi:hypothetical protein
MKWYSLTLWFGAIGLEGVLLVRIGLWRAFKPYSFFFTYLLCVFGLDVLFLDVYFCHFSYYASLYWYGEFLSVAVGCAVSWEIFRLVLGPYPGAGQMARRLLLFAILVAVGKAAGDAIWGANSWPTSSIQLERDLRVIQAVYLAILALLSAYYRVPMSRNVRGIFMGYSLFIALSVITLTLRTWFGPSFQTGWVLVQPLSYIGVLLIWCKSLWRFEPEGAPKNFEMERDYQALVIATRKGLRQARAVLDRSTRQ